MMTKIISFSLWGNDKKYTFGALKNADLASIIYPGWTCRFYIGKSVPSSIISDLIEKKNTEVYVMNEEGNWEGMFWRFWPASDSNVEIMISRDCDSRLSMREKNAVDAWEKSDKMFHIMRDHPHHATQILGGMWGCKFPSIVNMKELISTYNKGDYWQVDQNFLREKVYPLIKDTIMVHDEFFEKSPFPSPRDGLEFVGQVFNENDETVTEHLIPLQKYLET